MTTEEPFILCKRKDSPYYQVRFKNPDKTSSKRFLSVKSTGETIRSKALVRAWAMYNESTVEAKSFVQAAKTAELSEEDLSKLLTILKDRGLICSATKPDAKNSEPLCQFLLNFWDTDKSPYIAEKRRMGSSIGLTYINESRRLIELYWVKFFPKDLILSEITRDKLKKFILYVDSFKFGWSRKLKIYRAGAIALKWAYNDELLDRDITAGLASFYGKAKERNILTMELAEALFSVKWEDERCKTINLIAMLTGMRCGEILALRKMDLGNNRLYVRHSWNRKEGLKTTKNGEERTVFFPFPAIINKLLLLADSNGGEMETLLFPAPLTKNKPMDIKLPNKTLKLQLQKIGLSKEESQKYCFHSWRHFYTTYMSDKVNQRALQSQTGHKTLSMLEHYGNHQIANDIIAIETAQKEIFGGIVSKLY